MERGGGVVGRCIIASRTARGDAAMTTELEHPGSEAFHNRIHDNHMYGLWELASQMTAHPTPKMIPYMWKWDLFESVLQESGEVVPIGNERRALQLFNPGLNGA